MVWELMLDQIQTVKACLSTCRVKIALLEHNVSSSNWVEAVDNSSMGTHAGWGGAG